jgi:hypothetical protein
MATKKASRCLIWVKSVVSSALTDVRFYPESDRLLRRREMTLCAISDQSAVQQNGSLIDHLVGAAKERERDGDAERLGGFQIDV